MYNLLISIAVGMAVALLIRVLGFSFWAVIAPGIIAFVACFILLARRVAVKVQKLVGVAQKDLSSAPANARDRQQKVEKAIKVLEEGLAYDKWQFMVGPEIHAQIGMIRYMVKDLEAAQNHLQRASRRNYMAMAIQGALYFQKKDFSKMEKAFELAVKSGKKESIVWAAYAWCLLQLKDKEKALKVLARAAEINPSDEKLKNSLVAVQNDKKLKMKPYEPMWWQFGLEQPPPQIMGGRRVQFERR